MADDQQIVDMVIDAYVTYLTYTMITTIDEDNPTRAGEVRGGRLQDDPTLSGIFVLFHPNDVSETGWKSVPSLAESNHPMGISGGGGGISPLPPFQIGGGEFLWWRRFTMEIGCFFINKGYTRNQARQYAHIVFGRAEQSIIKGGVDRDAGILGLIDIFGETVLNVILSSTRYTEGGGPPNDFIWRGRIHFDALTARTGD